MNVEIGTEDAQFLYWEVGIHKWDFRCSVPYNVNDPGMKWMMKE
jgi:hypothetical protein